MIHNNISIRKKIIYLCVLMIVIASSFLYFILDIPTEKKSSGLQVIIKKDTKFNYFNKCMLCNFEPSNYHPKSTYRDLLISSMFDTPSNIFPAIRSLRTTQSQATFVILTDNKTIGKIPEKSRRYLNDCAVRFSLVEKPNISDVQFQTWKMQRYLDYIALNQNKYSRVIIFDLSDTVFQGDPFPEELSEEKVYFSVENHKFCDSLYHQNSIKALLDHGILNNPSFILDKEIINGDLFGGGIESVISFLRLYTSHFNMNLSNVYVDNQVFFNYMIYSNMLEKNLIKYEIETERTMLVSVSASIKKMTSFSLGNVTHPGSSHPALVINQFKNTRDFNIEVFRVCPKGKIKIPNYLGKLKERQIGEMERCLSSNCSKLWYKY